MPFTQLGSLGSRFILPFSSSLLRIRYPTQVLRTRFMSSEPATKQPKLSSDDYRLIYWPGIPGRGEPIRLAFEQAGATYEDVALKGKEGANEVINYCSPKFKCPSGSIPPLAPPILHHGSDIVLSQLPNIMLYLGPKLGLVPEDDFGKYKVNQVFLTVCDLQNEAHDVHHPIAVSEYYEDQKEEAFRKSIDFRKNRLPKFLSYFNRLLPDPSSPYLVDSQLTYADLGLYHIVEGLKFAFPNALERLLSEYHGVAALHAMVKDLPRIKAYLKSERRKPFSMGLYREYPELDVEADLEEKKTKGKK